MQPTALIHPSQYSYSEISAAFFYCKEFTFFVNVPHGKKVHEFLLRFEGSVKIV